MRRLVLAALVAVVAGCSRAPAQPVGPTPVPEPPAVRLLAGRGVAIEGHGTTQTEDIVPQYSGGLSIGIDVVKLTHDGRSSFIVNAIQGDQTEQITSAVGAYQGQRPLVVEGPVAFQVTADGAWTLEIRPVPNGGTPAFSGTGDAVSAYFNPPTAGTWTASHDGQSNFFVFAHCLGGSVAVEDQVGAFQNSPRIEFPRGPCFWEVRADGAWKLLPP